MSGALPILVATGKQDTILTENPQTTFFRTNYKRYTNFAQALLSQVVQGNPSKGTLSTITLSKKGDLMSYVYLTKKVNATLQADITEDDIEYVEFVIGEQVIDKITSKQLIAMLHLNSRYPKTTNMGYVKNGVAGFYGTYHYPLGFWFCDNWMCSIPLVALQYHDVQIRIRWGENVQTNASFEAWVNYIYLDEKQRNSISNQETIDMLVYQHSETKASNQTITELPFNNPVSFIFSDVSNTNIFGKNITNLDDKLLIRVNGVDIVDQKELVPHYSIIPMLNHTVYGKWNFYDPLLDVEVSRNPLNEVTNVVPVKKTGTQMSFFYPFCLNSSSFQPSGTCNFSRLDGVYLVTTSNITKSIYARGYNVLRIQKGMGGLFFNS